MSKADDVFYKEFGAILALLVIFAVIAFILGRSIAADAQQTVLATEQATLERIRPVGQVKVAQAEPGAKQAEAAPAPSPGTAAPAPTAAAPAPAAAVSAPAPTPAPEKEMVAAASAPAATAATAADDGRTGEQVYQSICFACHVAGVLNAPKTGDKEAWTPRAQTGLDAMVQTVITGKGGMPPMAGNPKLTKGEITRAVQYFLEQAGLPAG